MTTTLRNWAFRTCALSTLMVLTLAAVSHATTPQPLLLPPGQRPLPTFGFNSYNVAGYGEVLTFVRYNSIARRMGLEPGDVILRLNGYRLDYHGAWRDALSQAVYNGGFVRLAIRDVNTGQVSYRQIYLPSSNVGPITPKSHVAGKAGRFREEYRDGYPGPIVGPITPKSKPFVGVGGKVKLNNNFNHVKKLIHKFEKKD